jgi:hypothetical protein
MSQSRAPGTLFTAVIENLLGAPLALAALLGQVLIRSSRRAFRRGGVSSPPRPVVSLPLIAMVATLGVSAGLVPLAGPASASPPAGMGGMLKQVQARIADTRTGTGGHSGAMLANSNWVSR